MDKIRRVLKYALNDWNNFVMMPSGAEILSVQIVDGELALWALVDETVVPELRNFLVVYTGDEIDEQSIKYIGTTTIGHPFNMVYHIFEVYHVR